jgi:hypothetical protein
MTTPHDRYLRAATLRLLQGLPVTLPGRVGPIRRRGIGAGAMFAEPCPAPSRLCESRS